MLAMAQVFITCEDPFPVLVPTPDLIQKGRRPPALPWAAATSAAAGQQGAGHLTLYAGPHVASPGADTAADC